MALNTLDLFSGIGGFARGLEATNFFNTTCFVEQDPYCQAVLKHHWPDVPVLGDIRSVQGPDLPIRPDVICGGFPCQPFSHAGKQQAQDDPRHLWPEMFRLIRECRPTWVVGENVIGLVQLGLDEVLSDLEGEGYAQGRLIFQLARLAPRTSDSDSGLLHTPTAKANQMAPSMATRDNGSWVLNLGGAKPHHMVPTPTAQDHISRKSTNQTPSTGKLNYETNKSVSLDRWVEMWPTPTVSDHKGSGPTVVRKDGMLRSARLD